MLSNVANSKAPHSLNRRKIATGFFCILAIVLGLSINSIYQLTKATEISTSLYRHPYAVSNAAKNINIYLETMHRNMKDVMLATSIIEREIAIDEIAISEGLVFRQYDVIFDRFLGDKTTIEESYEAFINWRPLRDSVIDFMRQGRVSEAKLLMDTKGSEYLKMLNSKIGALDSFAYGKAEAFYAEAILLKKRLTYITGLLSLLAIVIISGFIFSVWRTVSLNDKERRRRQHLIDEHIMIALLDSDGRVEDVSHALCRFFDCWKEELIGQKNRFFLPLDAKSKALEKEIFNSLDKGAEWVGETTHITADEQTIWAESSILPNFDENYVLVGYTHILRDVTNEKLANVDKLTGLLNRRSYDEILPDQISIAGRNQYSVILAIIDIDYFKRFNDLYGHPAGDTALQKLSEYMASCMKRPNDFAFRLGGEEFALVFSGLKQEETEHFLNHIRCQIEKLKIPNENSSVGDFLTVSIGAVFAKPDLQCSTKILYETADKALYTAKGQRNSVAVAILDGIPKT